MAHLDLGHFPKAIAELTSAMECLQATITNRSERAEDQWRWKIALAMAYAGQARIDRSDSSLVEAERNLQNAANCLEATLKSFDTEFPIAGAPTSRDRAARFRLHFDALLANYEVAEECVFQGVLNGARRRLDDVLEPLRRKLYDFVEHESIATEVLGDKIAEMRNQLDRCQAYFAFLAGRIMIRRKADAVCKSDEIAEIGKKMNEARQVDSKLTSWVDLELGAFLLANANRQGDNPDPYKQAISILEAAANAGQVTPSREASRLLQIALAKHSVAVRRAKQLAGKAE
jgi:hypothetical protein